MIPVFRANSIIQYDEINSDVSWSYEDLLCASSFYATCIVKGLETSLSYSLSYMYVMINKHPDMSFSKIHMNIISSIINKDL
jgi:hypothetical protein